ncbi:unnamed protein product [Miscanthus lutarioriparius]|uniref:HXXXD-type acyl-transferase family protein n=1 Tax=Miscanthus lutarioriparius TaxID=422564 RepID=A0A811PNP0_9POAL|nr:unnamed protein product [Miscanthus lutarioriparius]
MEPTPAAPRVHLQSPQTAVPTRAVEPGRTRRIAVAAPPLPAAALQRRTRVVLYYRADAGEKGASRLWEEAMWAKESLSEAVADHPEMAGRLRRHADGSWEVKLNDAGVRLVEATAEVTLDEFLEAVQDKDRARSWEAALAPWVDVNAEDPDVSALVYVQLTRFQGDGGFAVGVSCSLMLSDPLSLARFLASWARTHARMKAQNDVATHPLMHDHVAETVLFRARPATTVSGTPDHHVLAVACVAQAKERLGAAGKVPPQFPIVIFDDSDGKGGLSVETCAAAYRQPQSGGGRGYKLEDAQWQELGLEELVLRDSKPLHVSYSILKGGSGSDGLAVVMPDGGAAGVPFNLARNPNFQALVMYLANTDLGECVPPGYNKLRTTLLQQGRVNAC